MPEENIAFERLEDQINWYDKRSGYNQRMFKSLKAATLILSVSIPLAAAFTKAIITGALGAAIALLEDNIREMDSDLCPPILRNEYVVHISFKMKIIKYALDNFPGEYRGRDSSKKGPRVYQDSVYRELGLV